jgi:hypothetical protein
MSKNITFRYLGTLLVVIGAMAFIGFWIYEVQQGVQADEQGTGGYISNLEIVGIAASIVSFVVGLWMLRRSKR